MEWCDFTKKRKEGGQTGGLVNVETYIIEVKKVKDDHLYVRKATNA